MDNMLRVDGDAVAQGIVGRQEVEMLNRVPGACLPQVPTFPAPVMLQTVP